MHDRHQGLASSLKDYAATWGSGLIRYPALDRDWEQETQADFLAFLREHPDALDRSCVKGHITSSAMVMNPTLDRTLMTLHAKLGKWLQLGGHVDGDSDIAASALREAREESGLDAAELFRWEHYFDLRSELPLPIDCDIHAIPARKDEAEHLHFDVRYLVILDDALPLAISEESKDLRWFTFDEARRHTAEVSMLRQFEKIEAIRRKILTTRQ